MLSNELIHQLVEHFEAESEGKPSPLSTEQKITMLRNLKSEQWARTRGLAAADRALVQAAEKAGKVQKVGRNVSGLPEQEVAPKKPRLFLSGSPDDLLRDLGLSK